MNRGTKSKADSSLSESIYRNGCSQELSSDKNGKVLNNSRVENEVNKISEYFDRLDHEKSTKIVMESSGLWYNIYECLSTS